jgi:hypothetical protein
MNQTTVFCQETAMAIASLESLIKTFVCHLGQVFMR